MRQHCWSGAWIDDAEAEVRPQRLAGDGHPATVDPVDPDLVITACDRIGSAITAGHAPGALAATDPGTLRDLAGFLREEGLRHILHTELGDHPRLASPVPRPALPAAPLAAAGDRAGVVEAWQPLGLLAHVVPANAPVAGPVSLVEGLLAGNANIMKTSARQGLLTQQVAAELARLEPALAPYLMVLRFGAERRSWLRMMCRQADGVVVWGGDAAVAGVAELVPPGARLVTWGPKISFAYLTAATWADPAVLAAVARDVCAADQQTCTSPQTVYLDTAGTDRLWQVAGALAGALAEVNRGYPPPEPDLQEQAEISDMVLVARHEELLGLSRVWSGPGGRWHVVAEADPGLRASPLYRTLRVQPLPRAAVAATLRSLRRYLQTVGLGAADLATADGRPTDLVRLLVAAGAYRVTPAGRMHESYPGEPHDGEYPLRRFSRRVGVQLAG